MMKMKIEEIWRKRNLMEKSHSWKMDCELKKNNIWRMAQRRMEV
jgi:hypothetical protein